MLRSLHMKLVMIMVLLILSLMTVVGAFLINSVMAFYLEDFYTQMSNVFARESLTRDLTTATQGEEDGAQAILDILETYSGELGLNGYSRTLFIWTGRPGSTWPATTTMRVRTCPMIRPISPTPWPLGRTPAVPIWPPTIWTWPSPWTGGAPPM